VTRINTKLEWFTDFKSWIEDVATFLDEKFPALEKIENDNSSVLQERREMLLRRRYQDDSDDVALFTGANIPVKYMTEEEANKVDEEAMEVDELGRTRSDTDLQPRSFPRKNRRLERQKRHALRTQAESAQQSATDEGDSTDDELVASDSQDLRAASESLVQAVEGLFADVESEEYKDPSLGIRPRFEDWKHRYGEEYGHAFAGLAMVGVWEFWARTELAAWNPFYIAELQQGNPSLESFSWHKALTDFQHARASSVEAIAGAEQLDPADDVVHGMVATVVVPRLRRLVLDGFDPYSSSGTTKALATVEEITYCLETNHVRFEASLTWHPSMFGR
jgi:GC-rich sequence DNA-binding factor